MRDDLCDHGIPLKCYCEDCVGDDGSADKRDAGVAGFLLGAGVLALVVLVASTCNGCAHVPVGGEYRPGLDLVTLEYEQAVRLEVDCVYPAPLAGSPAETLVNMLGGLPKGGYGSGVAVGPGAVVTARHVVDCDFELPFGMGTLNGNPMMIKGTTWHGTSFELVVQEEGADGADDFALLVATSGGEPFSHWAVPRQTNPHKGETVCVMAAYPWFQRSCGEAGVPDKDEGDAWMGLGYVVYDAHSDPGNSGSGVYDSRGWLVAIHVASVGRSRGGGYMVGRWRGRVPEAYAPLEWR